MSVPPSVSKNTPLSDWLLEPISASQSLAITYVFDTQGLLPVAAVPYRVVSLQDPELVQTGMLDSEGSAIIEGLLPGPVEVILGPEDTAAVNVAVEKQQGTLEQDLDSLRMLLMSQQQVINQHLASHPRGEHLRYSQPLDHPDHVTGIAHAEWADYVRWVDDHVGAATLLSVLAAGDVRRRVGKGRGIDSEGNSPALRDTDRVLEVVHLQERRVQAAALLFFSDERIQLRLAQYLTLVWESARSEPYSRGFVLDVMHGVLQQILLDFSGRLSAQEAGQAREVSPSLQQCQGLYPAIEKMTSALCVSYVELLLLFEQSKLSRKVMAVSGREAMVQWREPPVYQRCLNHFDNHNGAPLNHQGVAIQSLPALPEGAVGNTVYIDHQYVHGFSGEVVLTDTDFTIPGPVPLVWRRYYRSGSTGGWRFYSDETLRVRQGQVAYYREDGLVVMFALPPVGKYATHRETGLSIYREGYRVFSVRGGEQADRVFRGQQALVQPSGGLVGVEWLDTPDELNEDIPLRQIGNGFGQYWTLEYHDGQCVALSSTWGTRIMVTYDADGHRCAVTLRVPSQPSRTLVTYHWQANQLVVVEAQGMQWGYRYQGEDESRTSEPMLVAVELPNAPAVTFTWAQYDGLWHDGLWRCIGSQTATSRWHFSWASRGGQGDVERDQKQLPALVATVSALDISTHKPLGKARSWHFDARGNMVYQQGSDGAVWHYQYDTVGNVSVVRDAEGNRWQYRFDGMGLSGCVTPAGGGYSIARDDHGRVVEYSNALGESWSGEYDDAGQIRAIVNPSGLSYRVHCDGAGCPVGLADDEGWRRYWQRDSRGQLVVDGGNGRFNQASYDEEGARLTLEDRGQCLAQYQYDEHARLVGIHTEVGSHLNIVYGSAGFIEQVQSAAKLLALGYRDGAIDRWREQHQEEAYALQVERDALGRVSALSSHQHHLRCEYQEGGRPVGLVLDNMTRYQLTYDGLGRLLGCDATSVVNDAEASEQNLSMRWQYDAVGKPIQGGAEHHGVMTQYDALGRMVERVDGNCAEAFTYHWSGKLASFQQMKGDKQWQVNHEYNAHGFRVSSEYSLGYRVEFSYSAVGLLAQVSVNGNSVLSIHRDSMGVEEYRNLGAMSIRTGQIAVERFIEQQASEWNDRASAPLTHGHNRSLFEMLTVVDQLAVLPLPPLLTRAVRRGAPARPSGAETQVVIYDPVDGEALMVIANNQLYFNQGQAGYWHDWDGQRVEDMYLPVEKEVSRVVGMLPTQENQPFSLLDAVGPNMANSISLTSSR